MTLITQDGRTLEIAPRYLAKFTTVLYVGRMNIYYISVTLRPRLAKHSRIEVKLGEYPSFKEAKEAQTSAEQAFTTGVAQFVMPGNNGLALKDDLMAAVDSAVQAIAPNEYCIDFGMINGKSNCFGEFCPDEYGSYETSLAKWRALQRESA